MIHQSKVIGVVVGIGMATLNLPASFFTTVSCLSVKEVAVKKIFESLVAIGVKTSTNVRPAEIDALPIL